MFWAFVKRWSLAKFFSFYEKYGVERCLLDTPFVPPRLVPRPSMQTHRTFRWFTGVSAFLFCPLAKAEPHPLKDATVSTPPSSFAPIAITAISFLGRSAVRHHSAYGGEVHVDQEFRFGRMAPWLLVVGGSLGEMFAPHEGRYWLYGANLALKRELGPHREHGLELGGSIDAELLRPGHVEYGKMTPAYLGPYGAYTFEFNRRFFAAADIGIGFRLGPYDTGAAHTWVTLGFGVNAFAFLCLPFWGGFLFKG